MYLTDTEYDPPKRHEVTKLLHEFMSSKKEKMEVVFSSSDYCSSSSCRSAFAVAVKSNGLPIKVSMLKGRVYLLRTDSDDT